MSHSWSIDPRTCTTKIKSDGTHPANDQSKAPELKKAAPAVRKKAAPAVPVCRTRDAGHHAGMCKHTDVSLLNLAFFFHFYLS